ncbi:MAG: ACT domain-containing protein [Blastocatellia bacterium]
MLTLSILPEEFAICRLDADSPVPSWAFAGNLSSVTRTADEMSIVCEQKHAPEETRCDRDWLCLKVHGPLDFSLTGVMASLAVPLAEAEISLFALSTFDTDYLMVKESNLEKAIRALTDAGHEIHR